MPISQEQIDRYKKSPTPPFLSKLLPDPMDEGVYRGGSAVVKKMLTPDGKKIAVKTYLRLEGSDIPTLHRYGQTSNEDEKLLIGQGIDSTQIVKAQYVISGIKDAPMLYAVQEWDEGRTLASTPLTEILRNKQLRRSLSEVLLKCASLKKDQGKYADLIGGKRLRISGMDILNPMGIIFPWLSTNIKHDGQVVRIIDAKTIDNDWGGIRLQAVKVNRLATVVFAKALHLIDKFDH